jgi:hypothetical protein
MIARCSATDLSQTPSSPLRPRCCTAPWPACLFHSQLESFIKGLGLPDRTPKASSKPSTPSSSSSPTARKRKRNAAPENGAGSAAGASATQPKAGAPKSATPKSAPRSKDKNTAWKKEPKDHVHEAPVMKPLFPSGQQGSNGLVREKATAEPPTQVERDAAESFLRPESGRVGKKKGAGRPGKGGMGGRGKANADEGSSRRDSAGASDESKAASLTTLRKKLVVELSPQWHGVEGTAAHIPKGQARDIHFCHQRALAVLASFLSSCSAVVRCGSQHTHLRRLGTMCVAHNHNTRASATTVLVFSLIQTPLSTWTKQRHFSKRQSSFFTPTPPSLKSVSRAFPRARAVKLVRFG